jgi:hypothetical protein
MNLSHRMQRVWSVVLVGVAIGCSDSTPIGSIQCMGELIRCGFTEKQQQSDAVPTIQPPTDAVSSTDLDVLSPTFTRRAFEDLPEFDFHLLAEPDGDLWSVRGDGPRLILEKRDREGTALEEVAIAPPKGTPKPQRYSPIDIESGSRSSARSLRVFAVTWSRTCDGSASSEDCQISEVLAFDDLAEPPRRMATRSWPPAIQATESGTWLLYGDHIDKYDSHGKLAWRQTGLLPLERPDFSWNAVGAVHPNNELSVLLALYSTTSDDVALELWRIDALGNIDERQHVAWDGSVPYYAIDPQGRNVIVGTFLDGGLSMMRVGPDLAVEGNVIEREEYLDLRPDAFALDADGAVYVTARAGGREPSEMREMLCQLPVSGKVRCFTLGELIAEKTFSVLVEDLVVPEPGIVYVRTGADLRRYELPPL